VTDVSESGGMADTSFYVPPAKLGRFTNNVANEPMKQLL
jgi:hypothetical protein